MFKKKLNVTLRKLVIIFGANSSDLRAVGRGVEGGLGAGGNGGWGYIQSFNAFNRAQKKVFFLF